MQSPSHVRAPSIPATRNVIAGPLAAARLFLSQHPQLFSDRRQWSEFIAAARTRPDSNAGRVRSLAETVCEDLNRTQNSITVPNHIGTIVPGLVEAQQPMERLELMLHRNGEGFFTHRQLITRVMFPRRDSDDLASVDITRSMLTRGLGSFGDWSSDGVVTVTDLARIRFSSPDQPFRQWTRGLTDDEVEGQIQRENTNDSGRMGEDEWRSMIMKKRQGARIRGFRESEASVRASHGQTARANGSIILQAETRTARAVRDGRRPNITFDENLVHVSSRASQAPIIDIHLGTGFETRGSDGLHIGFSSREFAEIEEQVRAFRDAFASIVARREELFPRRH